MDHKKSLLTVLLAAGLLSNASASKQSNLEELIKDSKQRQLSLQYPFMNDKILEYRTLTQKQILLFTASAEGNARFSIETILEPKSTTSKFTLEGETSHSLVGLTKYRQVSCVDYTPERFTTTFYSYYNSKSKSDEQTATNVDLSKTVLDELSVIQYIRSLNIEELSLERENGLVIGGLGINKNYPITIYRSNKITPITTPRGKFNDYWNVQIVLGKEQEQFISVYYTKDNNKTPIFIKKCTNQGIGKFYIK